jgi:hypothetical protein
MGKETSTTNEKESRTEAMDVERPDKLAKKDSDSSEGGSAVGTDNVMADTINDVDMMKSSPAIGSVPHNNTAAELPQNGKNSSKSTNGTYCDLHSEEEKQEVTEITNADNRAAGMGRDWRTRHSDSEEEEELDEDLTPGAFSNEQGNLIVCFPHFSQLLRTSTVPGTCIV